MIHTKNFFSQKFVCTMSSSLSSDFFLKIRKRQIVSLEFRAIIYLSILYSLRLLCKQSADSVEVASGSPLPGVKVIACNVLPFMH